MNRILIIFLIIGFYSCGEKQKSEKKAGNVEILTKKAKRFPLGFDFNLISLETLVVANILVYVDFWVIIYLIIDIQLWF